MPGAPVRAVPPRACDCHVHVYGARYPSVPGARLTPPDATVPMLRAMQRRLGLERVVLVTPSTYGTDNASLVDGLAALGARARGVAVVGPSVTDRELRSLHDDGVRGIRFNQTLGDATPIEALEPLARRVASLGWHLQLLARADDLVHLEPTLARLPVQVVFDHLGRLPVPGLAHPGHAVIRRLVDAGRAWVKLSGAYLAADARGGRSPDADSLARVHLAAAPERVVWGSDWPHPTASAGLTAMPDDAMLLGLLREWTGDDATFARVLVDNPARLYDFPRGDAPGDDL